MSIRTKWLLAIGVIAALVVGWQVTALATSLSGSNFEIDNDANLIDDTGNPLTDDWATISQGQSADGAEVRQSEGNNSGANDNSFGQGTKEDTAAPTVVSGSIPPNKSDLLDFGVYLETNANGRFLNVFWHRVQEPSGTTNMDFEFNQKVCDPTATPTNCAANGVTPVRTAGDVLIQYDLSQGGVNPQLFLSRWVTAASAAADPDIPNNPAQACRAANTFPCWGKRDNLTAAGGATGSINTSAITAANSDGLGDISPRTFGEAQIDFDALTGSSDQCTTLGSAYLKSRSSDSFTAALKDFIAPVSLNIDRCGALKIVKNSTKGGAVAKAGAVFSYQGPGASGPTASVTDNGTDDEDDTVGVVCVSRLATGNYTVNETSPPAGYGAASQTNQSVTVAAGTDCGDKPPGSGATATFINPPLADIQVRFRDGGSGETSLVYPPGVITCDNGTNGTTSTTDTTGWDDTTTVTGVKIDPSPQTITCTIKIDP